MTKIETELNMMLLKLCEDTLAKTAAAKDEKLKSVLKKIRDHLEAQAEKMGEKA